MPTTTGKATEFITFSRGSLATVTDGDGLIKWAPHNLLLASEQFDDTNWTKSSATVAANTEEAPNGTDTADTITASGANGTALQSYTAIAVPYTFGVWLKRKTGTGTIEIAADNGTYTAVTITSDWALYTVTQTPAAGSKSAGIRIVTSADEVYAWGAHLYRSDLGGMQANASAYPYYNPSTPTNLLGYSEAFDNAAWTKNLTITANALAAPNGSMSADLLSGSNGQYVTQTLGSVILSTLHTASVYLQAGTVSVVRLYVYKTSGGTNGYVDFNLTAGTAGTPAGDFPPTSATITPVGNGWYRCSFKTAFDTGTGIGYVLYNQSGSTGNFYAWGAQLSDSASLDPYVPNFGAAPSAAAAYGPRLDYDPVTLAAKGLLVEEARTNLLTYSAQFDAGDWILVSSGTGSAPVVTANAGTAPDGTSTADRIVFDRGAGTTSGDTSIIFQDPTDPSSGVGTISVWLRSYDGVSSYSVRLLCGFDGINITVTGTWQRFVLSSSTTTFNFQFGLLGNQNQQTADVLAWGGQAEYGSFATSYIPTAASTVTRNADVASVGVSQFPYSATEGTLVVSGDFVGFDAAKQPTFASITDGTPNSTPSASWVNISQDTSNVVSSRRSASTTATDITASNTQTANVVRKVGLAFKQGGTDALSVNGGTVATQSGVAAAYTNNILKIGAFDTASSPSVTDPFYLNGHVRQITYIPRQLSSAELEARTAL